MDMVTGMRGQEKTAANEGYVTKSRQLRSLLSGNVSKLSVDYDSELPH